MCVAAEFRGPGIHHRYDDSPEDFDMDLMHDHRARSFGNLGSRIILLGDGTEIEPNNADADMFDNDDEDHDLEHQVHRVVSSDEEEGDDTAERKQREGTPGPEKAADTGKTTEDPSSVTTEKSDTAAPAAATGGDTAAPAEATSKPAEEKSAAAKA